MRLIFINNNIRLKLIIIKIFFLLKTNLKTFSKKVLKNLLYLQIIFEIKLNKNS